MEATSETSDYQTTWDIGDNMHSSIIRRPPEIIIQFGKHLSRRFLLSEAFCKSLFASKSAKSRFDKIMVSIKEGWVLYSRLSSLCDLTNNFENILCSTDHGTLISIPKRTTTFTTWLWVVRPMIYKRCSVTSSSYVWEELPRGCRTLHTLWKRSWESNCRLE